MKITDDYVLFWNGPFSQWFLGAPFTVNSIEYNCAEQYMMAEKARLFGDNESLEKILAEKSPYHQKRLGKTVKNFNEKLWGECRQNIVTNGNIYKFSQNRFILDLLLSTKWRTLVEASPKDNIWGIGLDENDPRALNPKKWLGLNLLGYSLVEARDELREKNPIPKFDIADIFKS